MRGAPSDLEWVTLSNPAITELAALFYIAIWAVATGMA